MLNPTTLVIRKLTRPDDPPSSAPLVLKEIKGNIPKCAGCLLFLVTMMLMINAVVLPNLKAIDFGERKLSSGTDDFNKTLPSESCL